MTVVFTGFLSAGVTHEYQLYVKKSSGTSEQQAIEVDPHPWTHFLEA